MGLECSKCGWSQPEDGKRCPKCGARIEPTPRTGEAGSDSFGLPGGGFGDAARGAAPVDPAGVPPASEAGKGPPARRVVPLAMIMAVATGGAAVYFVTQSSGARVDTFTEQQGRVKSVEGTTPVEVGDACSVRVEPAKGRPYNCRLVVRCGSRTLYGTEKTNGYANCSVDAGVAWRAEESVEGDSDPDVYYDIPSSQLTVKDSGWRVDIELTSPPRSPP